MNIDLDAIIIDVLYMCEQIVDFWADISVKLNGNTYTFWTFVVATCAFTVIIDNFTGGSDE